MGGRASSQRSLSHRRMAVALARPEGDSVPFTRKQGRAKHMSRIHYAEVFEDSPKVLMDRVQNITGANITQAVITSISRQVFEYGSQEEAESNTEGTEVGTAASLTVSDVVFDTLQTTAPWDSTVDATGYNFKDVVPAAKFPTGRKWYRVEYLVTPTTGEAFPIVWIVQAVSIARS